MNKVLEYLIKTLITLLILILAGFYLLLLMFIGIADGYSEGVFFSGILFGVLLSWIVRNINDKELKVESTNVSHEKSSKDVEAKRDDKKKQ